MPTLYITKLFARYLMQVSVYAIFVLQCTDASILVYKFRPERTGFNMYAEYTLPKLTFLALVP